MNGTKSMINDLTQGSVVRKLLMFAYPFALANMIQVLYSLVDMMVIGRYVGSSGISGVAIGGDIMNFFMMVGMGFSNSGQVMVSQYTGRGDRKGINSVIGTMFSFIIGLALILTVVALCFSKSLLHLENAPAESYSEALTYITTCFCGLIFTYGYNTVSAILRGMGDSKRPFVFVAISTVANILFDLFFVAVLRLDVFGAALGTVMAQALSFILAVIYLYKKREAFGFDFKLKSFAIHKEQLIPMLKLGLPMALQSAAISLSFIYVNSLINGHGVIASAVSGVGGRLNQVMMVIGQATNMASSVMIGQNFGAGKYDRVKKVVHISLFICFAAAIILIIIYNLFPKEIYGVFSKDAEVLSLSAVYIKIMSIGFIAFALMSPYMSMINGIGFATFSFAIAFVESIFARVGLSYLLGNTLNMGIQGFWMGNALCTFITALLAGIYFYAGTWEKRKLIVRVSEQ